MSFEGSWTMTFLNTEEMKERTYFLKWIDEICNTNMDSQGLLGGLSVGGVSISELTRAGSGLIDMGANIASNPLAILGGIQPTYQKDIKIEQLDFEEEGQMAVRLIGAFPTSVGAIEYSETSGEVSSTTVTFSYTDVEVDDPISTGVGAIFGDSVGSLF